MKRAVITALISLAIPLLCLAQQTDMQSSMNQGKSPVMVTRSFDVLPTLIDKLSTFPNTGGQTEKLNFRTCFNRMGVEWPEGSSIRYISAIGKLIATNTEDNLRKLEDALGTLNVVPNQIEVEVKFIEYQLSDIEALAKQGGATQQALMNLWRQGKARLIHAPKVVTQSGTEATVKSVKEVIYPTEIFMDSPTGSGTNNLNVATNSAAVLPGGFEAREVGVILKVTPEVSTEGFINLTLSPEFVDEPTWKTYKGTVLNKEGKSQQVEIEQPFFFTQCFSTSMTVKNGSTVMASGGMMNRTNDKMVYCFVTARIVDVEGKPIRTSDSADSEPQKSGNK
jgi:type II secretory pathway component GspD/PulD (secretin)